MGRNIGPKGRLSRREGINLFLKGSRSYSDKDPIKRKPYAPGQHGNKKAARLSEYGVQLREKQKVKRMYDVREKQFKNMYLEADRKSKVYSTDKGLELLRLLETRLDNVVYLLGLAPSKAAARQYVTHKHVLVNGKTMNIPSYNVSAGDEITLKKENLKPVETLVQTPVWMQKDALSGKILSLPNREDIDPGIREHLIIEFYSR